MALVFTQTDTSHGCGVGGSYCGNGTGIEATNTMKKLASVGGTAGTSAVSQNFGATSAISIFWYMFLDLPAGAVGNSGTWTIRFNVTTANMNLSWEEVHLCLLDGCVNQRSLGSATGLGISMGTTGVKSTTVSGSSADLGALSVPRILILLAGKNNNPNMVQSFAITPNQNIDSPFTVAQQSLLFIPPAQRLQPILVR